MCFEETKSRDLNSLFCSTYLNIMKESPLKFKSTYTHVNIFRKSNEFEYRLWLFSWTL